jgi:hypothetical protein
MGRSGRWLVRVVSRGALVASLALTPASLRADPPSIEARLEALGPAREGEEALFGQLARALATAEAAAAEGDSARAERHRDLAEALVRSVAARRRAAEGRRRLTEREAAIAAARARLALARAAEAHAGEAPPSSTPGEATR